MMALMKAKEIYDRWRKSPFEPFTLVMSNDERWHVRRSDVLLVTKSMLALGISDPQTSEGIVDRIIPLSQEEVVKIEPVNSMH